MRSEFRTNGQARECQDCGLGEGSPEVGIILRILKLGTIKGFCRLLNRFPLLAAPAGLRPSNLAGACAIGGPGVRRSVSKGIFETTRAREDETTVGPL